MLILLMDVDDLCYEQTMLATKLICWWHDHFVTFNKYFLRHQYLRTLTNINLQVSHQ